MPILLKVILNRFFVFMYLLGFVSMLITITPSENHPYYGNVPWELLIQVFLLSCIIYIIPRKRYRLFHWFDGTWYSQLKDKLDQRLIVKALVYCFMYPLYIIDTFCLVKFGCTLNPSMLLLMGETNGNEASEFFQNYVTIDTLFTEVGVIMLVPLAHVISIFAWKYLRKKITLPKVRLPRIASVCADLVVAGIMFTCGYMSWDNMKLYYETISQKTIGGVEHSLAYNPHTMMYQPTLRFIFSVRSNQLIGRQLDDLFQTLDEAKVDSCSYKSPEIVLIIGESCNKRHFQLYGYDKPNTPNQMRLERTGLLTKFDDVVAPWNLTSFVFKHLMTTYCVGDSADWCNYPLFCQLFRNAGYKVTFLTNQFLPKAKQEVYDFSGGFFINNPELSKKQFDIRNNELHIFDDGLLSDWDALHQSGVNSGTSGLYSLSIFHVMGQHVSYRVRCPNSKKKWRADDYPNDMDMPEKKRRLMADYDNAVWYNDSVVNQIVERFNKDDAIIIYLSDHGEEVFGKGMRHFCGRLHNATITKRLADEEFRIPMWIYCTPKYKQLHPDVFNAVKAAKDKKFMSDALSQMLLGLAGIHTKWYNPQQDLLSPQYNPNRKRILKHTTDYDTLK